MSKERLLGPIWMSGSPGLVLNTVCRRLLLASRTWTRNSWVLAKLLPKFWMRSDQLRVTCGTVVGTVNVWVMFGVLGPVESVKASKEPEMGGRGVAGLTGSMLPLLIRQPLAPTSETVQPVKSPVSKPPLVIRLTLVDAEFV